MNAKSLILKADDVADVLSAVSARAVLRTPPDSLSFYFCGFCFCA
jgi:hypothetical protein